MSLLTLSRSTASAETLPLIQERAFSVRLRCSTCDRERSQIVCMADEPNDAATIHDFYQSGADREIDPDCMYCGETGAVVLGVIYLRQPGDDQGNAI